MTSTPAWSYSSLKLFETCPKKYESERITKEVKFTDNEATLYGTAMHLAAEEYIRDGKELPPQFEFLRSTLDKLNSYPGDKHCEIKLGIAKRDGRLEACDFFADGVWFRGVGDLVIVNGEEARVIDYKSSKNAKYADSRQLALMAAAIFLRFPEVKVVKGALLFVVSNDVITTSYVYDRRFDIFAELSTLLSNREAAYSNGVFNPKSNGLCRRWCQTLSCPHNGANQ